MNAVSAIEVERPIKDVWRDVVQLVKEEYLSTDQSYPWIVGSSGRKDSTVVAQAVFEALLAVPPSARLYHDSRRDAAAARKLAQFPQDSLPLKGGRISDDLPGGDLNSNGVHLADCRKRLCNFVC